jgi:hypothetical protein
MACRPGFYCDGMGMGACQPLLTSGASCSFTYQCAMPLTCSGGHCM